LSEAKSAGAFSWIALVFLAGLVGGGIVNLYSPLPIWVPLETLVVGVPLFVLGITIFLWARMALRRHRTTLMVWSPSSELVQDGPYAFSRNPIYLGFALLYLGTSLILDSGYILIMLLVVVVLFDRLQIPREEKYLEERFGEAFMAYRARVRRWF
jgi:protein-S-isoprenylcysteine O-methyltransferase Ste14